MTESKDTVHDIEDAISTRSVAEDAARRAGIKPCVHANPRINDNTRRRSARTASKRIDYLTMHNEGKTRVVKTTPTTSRVRTPANTSPNGPMVKANPTGTATNAQLYRAREIHEAFFRPGYVPPAQKKSKKKKEKRVILTDKERRQWAKEHWYLHHGHENPSISGVQTHKSTVKTVPYTLPSWDVAKPLVFDSSSDEQETLWPTSDSSQVRVDQCNVMTPNSESSDLWAAPASQVEDVSSKVNDVWAESAYIPSSEESEEQDGRELNETWFSPTKAVTGSTGDVEARLTEESVEWSPVKILGHYNQ